MIPNGTFTIENTKTGQHRTFLVKTQAEDSNFAPGKRVVCLLTGPDNRAHYEPFGFVNDLDGEVNVWRRLRGENGKRSAYEHFADMLGDLSHGGQKYGPKGYTILVEKKCLRCNRKLTTPESIERGIGPECWEKENPDAPKVPKPEPKTGVAQCKACGRGLKSKGSFPICPDCSDLGYRMDPQGKVYRDGPERRAS